jgi:hypothetical protein
MKEIAIIGSYCNTDIKLNILEKQIDKLKLLDLDILVFGKYPLPSYLQKKCDYFIFDKSNPVIEDRVLYHYLYTHGKKINYIFKDYGYAALEQITKSLGFVKSLNYDIAYWLVYDVDVTEFSSFRNLSLKKLLEFDAVCSVFRRSNANCQGLDGTSVSFKVQTSYDKLKGNITKTFYKDLIDRKGNDFISEDFMEECFRIGEVNYYITEEKNLPAVLSSTVNRKLGEVGDEFPKTSKYFRRCFIGKDVYTNKYVIWIDNILQDVNNIKLQINDGFIVDKNVTKDINGGIEINIDKAHMLKIISINDEEINELLDPELNDEYYDVNIIQNSKPPIN